ncbi:hypothetical protein BLNAU_11362 [Blattamonas nauphoetae]|uniref:Uncharacterized protein n=1 Tax=Blattamonas nauphoetae TaxID=2049346 RepID=A0ABQ9XNM4_9EUKA|nr:hypothetical protein BLNAU_11362 [Blattamonas nauphoetae]
MENGRTRLRIVSQRQLGQPPAEGSRCPILSWIDCAGDSCCHGNWEHLRKRSSLREGPHHPRLHHYVFSSDDRMPQQCPGITPSPEWGLNTPSPHVGHRL